ncbi:Rha family transcriptional regulator [Clostridium hominis]|nr:Rha family transcriptional regulator [Clostridium hominis]
MAKNAVKEKEIGEIKMENLKHKHKDVVIKKIDGELVVTSRQVAEDFEKEHKNVLQTINNLVAENSAVKNMIIESTYENRGKYYPEYLLTRDGFSLLVMGFTGSRALQWKLKYIEAFNKMEQELKGQALNTSELSPELQMFKKIFDSVAKQQLEAKETQRIALEANDKAEEAKEEIQGIRYIVAINSTNWRKETSTLISKIALKLGGYENINLLREESYKILEERGRTRLSVKLTNKRRRMADEGVCKSKRDKLNKLDVIGEDSRLLEIYLAVVKDMAIKYGVA